MRLTRELMAEGFQQQVGLRAHTLKGPYAVPMSAATQPEADAPAPSLFRRLSRSSRKLSNGVAPTVERTPPEAASQATNASTTSFSTTAKIPALAKLRVQLGRRTKRSKLRCPPSSWNLERNESSGSHEPSTTMALEEPTLEESVNSTSVEESEAIASSSSGGTAAEARVDPLPDPNMDHSSAEEPMSANSLACRIQSLLSSLPPFYALSPSGPRRFSKDPSDQGSDHARDAAGGPLADSKLLALLSSASAMNGSISKGRESVWSILESLKYSPNAKAGDSETNPDERGTSSSDDSVETSSVMICCPLEPTEESDVEIARSEIVSIDVEDEGQPLDTPHDLKPGFNVWPFGRVKDKRAIPSPRPSIPPPKVKEVRVWYPSRTKVSLQAAWWGYRIYLPPPVMRILSDKSLEAAKRAAMVTAALSWLVSNIPTNMLPPPLKAVVSIVKGIVPIVGYVGGFIAWSWNTIQSFDKGQGVILSATWLLPIALIPGTWDYTQPRPSNSRHSSSNSISIPPVPPPKDPGPPSRPAILTP